MLVAVFASLANAQLVYDSVRVTDQVGGSKWLVFGIDPTATDGIDLALGEGLVPPFPPTGAFEARFFLPENNFSGTAASWRDFRFMDSVPYWGTKEFRLAYQPGTGSPGMRIEWNWPASITGVLQDLFGGVLINIPMSGTGFFNVTPALDRLKMVVTYDSSLSVELTSFGASVKGSTVQLSWQTSSEINNLGFDVERKSANTTWQKIAFVRGAGSTTSAQSYSYVDEDVTTGTYTYRLKQIDFDGTSTYSKEVEVDMAVSDFHLYQNYPNPFNPSTAVRFSVPTEGLVTVKVHDMLGQEITTLFYDNASAGVHTLSWNGKDSNGNDVSSGSYICRLTAGEFTQSVKMIFLK
ncbi:MAG: T9SS type A sorting domain-containing protein [Ignavibacteriales bacterium]|nr:MAG: T9SS type A sorting domain-containing protein [Ignavibacteriales bacterium]